MAGLDSEAVASVQAQAWPVLRGRWTASASPALQQGKEAVMRTWRRWILAGLILAATPWPAPASVFVGLRFGGPCYRPALVGGFAVGYRPYYPVYLAPPPLVVAPAAVVVQPAAVVAGPVPSAAVAAAPAGEPPTATPTVVQAAAQASGQDASLAQLGSPDEQSRAQAAVQLGRLKVRHAVGPLTRLLQTDPSPAVREAAARGLGLIGEAYSLAALQQAAQADSDRDVRHSASFAADVIRSQLPR
jgi:hypothetical protein